MMPAEFATDRVSVIPVSDWGPDLGIVAGSGHFREIVGPARGAKARGLYNVSLEAHARTQWLRHPGEAAYFVVDGSGRVVGEDGSAVVVGEGSMIHCAPGTAYSMLAAPAMLLLGGPCPVDPALAPVDPPLQVSAVSTQRDVAVNDATGVRGFHRDAPGLMVPFISQDARLVVWLGAGAESANMNHVVLQPGERNREHVHRFSEDTIHVLSGRGTVEDVTNGLRLDVGPGDTVQIPPGVWHAVAADLGETMVSVGGPCPADLDMLRAVGADVDSFVDDVDAFIARHGVSP